MAQFIAVSQNEPVGLNALRVRDLLFELEKAVNEVTRPLEKLAADDAGTYTAVAAALGLNSTDDAHDLYEMALAVRNRLATAEDSIGESAFRQYAARVNRASF